MHSTCARFVLSVLYYLPILTYQVGSVGNIIFSLCLEYIKKPPPMIDVFFIILYLL